MQVIIKNYTYVHFGKTLILFKTSKMKKLLILTILTLAFSSCKNTESVTGSDESNQNTAYLSDVIENDDFDDPCNILEVSISKNTMRLIVNYSGGCSSHEFQLAGSSSVMKSFPPKRNVSLLHNGNNDLCKMLVTDTVTFNIESLSNDKNPGSEIILNLKGWETPISYTYVKP